MWVDITGLCKDASNQMSFIEPMMNTEDFSLFDAMSAVELMDPKMDQCYNVKSSIDTGDLMKVQVPEHCQLSSIVKILQSLVVHEVSFLDGASPLESTHQCVLVWEGSWEHASKRDDINTRAVLSFAKSLDRSIASVTKCVLAADIYEDDDYSPLQQTVLSTTLSDEAAITSLDSSLSEVGAICEGKGRGQGEDNEQQQSAKKLIALLKYRKSLQSLYKIVGDWTHNAVADACSSRGNKNSDSNSRTGKEKESENESEKSVRLVCVEGKRAADSVLSTVKEIQREFKLAEINSKTVSTVKTSGVSGSATLTTTATATATATGATATGEPDDGLSSVSADPDTSFAFNELVPKLMQNHAARSIKPKAFSECLQYTSALCNEIIALCGVYESIVDLETHKKTLDYETLLQLSLELVSGRPHLLTRSLFLWMLYTVKLQMTELVVRSMYIRGIPEDVLAEGTQVRDQWIPLSVISTAWDTLKALCVSRHRLLGKIDNVLSSWGNIVQEASIMDTNYYHYTIEREAAKKGIASDQLEDEKNRTVVEEVISQLEMKQYMNCWTLLTTTALMDLQLGVMIESDLVGQEELCYYYWYWEFVYNSRAWGIDKLRCYRYKKEMEVYEEYVREQMQNQLGVSEGKGKGKAGSSSSGSGDAKSKAKKKTAASTSAAPPTIAEPTVSPEELVVRAKSLICRGLFRMFAVGLDTGAIRKTDEAYTTNALKFENRFFSFSALSNPPLLTYEDYVRQISGISSSGGSGSGAGGDSGDKGGVATVDPVMVIDAASQCFVNARKYVDGARKLTSIESAPAPASGGSTAVPSNISSAKHLADLLSSTHMTTEGAQLRAADLAAHCSAVTLTKYIVTSSVGAMKITQFFKTASPVPNGHKNDGVSIKNINKKNTSLAAVQLDFTLNRVFPVVEFKPRS